LEFPEGGRGIVCGPFLKKSRGEGGSYEKSLPWVGYGYFLEPHNANLYEVCPTGGTPIKFG